MEPLSARWLGRAPVVFGWVFIAAGCALGPTEGEPDPEELAIKEARLTEANGIYLTNGLNLGNGFNLGNGVTLGTGLNLANGRSASNGINLGTTAYSGVPADTLAPPAGSDLEKWIDFAPTMRKRILKYLVQCALSSSATVTLKYRGGTEVLAAGGANLGPSIAAGLMTLPDQEKVTGCLLARVNAKGDSVKLDLFGPMKGFTFATTTELDTYSITEASFYGNVFLSSPKAFICANAGNPLGLCSFRACAQPDGSCNCGLITPSTQSRPDIDPCDGINAPCGFNTFSTIRGGQAYFDTYQNSCTSGGYTWNYPITVREAKRGAGANCSASTDCLSGACTDSVSPSICL